MKTYEVELKRTAYVIIRVEAENEDDAEGKAWDELRSDGSYGLNYGEWDLESIQDMDEVQA
jgi:hypothetical protein